MSMKLLAQGLGFVEGPVVLDDGSVLVVQVDAGNLLRVFADGRVQTVACIGGGPAGAALGPDGGCYIANTGGFNWHRRKDGTLHPGLAAKDHRGGRIERVDLATGDVKTLYTETDKGPLRAPDDLVFDGAGGFWFTDLGLFRERGSEHGGVYYARADGSAIREAVFPMMTANGIGLSPDGATLYVAETVTGRLWAFELGAPGEIVRRKGYPNGGRLVIGFPGYEMLDSLAVEADGNICVATMHRGCISVVSPDGRLLEQVKTPDPANSNIAFGGPDLRTAYVTLSSTGGLAVFDWPRAGLALHWRDRAASFLE
ncbi:MAG: SMP-30/gluconolactonase/LRE family protein [Rubrivivax sp.]